MSGTHTDTDSGHAIPFSLRLQMWKIQFSTFHKQISFAIERARDPNLFSRKLQQNSTTVMWKNQQFHIPANTYNVAALQLNWAERELENEMQRVCMSMCWESWDCVLIRKSRKCVNPETNRTLVSRMLVPLGDVKFFDGQKVKMCNFPPNECLWNMHEMPFSLLLLPLRLLRMCALHQSQRVYDYIFCKLSWARASNSVQRLPLLSFCAGKK